MLFFSLCHSMTVKLGSEFLYQEYSYKINICLVGAMLGNNKVLCILAKHISVDFTLMHHSPTSKCFPDIGLQMPHGSDAKSQLVLEI